MNRRSQLTRRRLLTYATYATGGTLLAACQVGQRPPAASPPASPPPSPAAASGTPGRKTGGTVIVASGAVGTLENSLNLGTPTPRYLYEIYDRLVQEDLTVEADAPPIVPGLAEKWEVSPDASVYTFTLRQGVKFHDGTPFDAEAVRFNVERLSKPDHPFYYERGAGTTAIGWGRVAQIDVVDQYTIRLRLKGPYAHLPELLARAEYSIASPENITKLGNDKVGNSPVGTGPFKFVSHEQGSKLELARNGDYWGGAPIIDGIVVRIITEPTAAVSALQAGEVHLVADVVVPDIARSLEADPTLTVRVRETPGVVHVALNVRAAPLSDKRVRQALNYALDRETYVRDILRGYGASSKAFFAPSAVAFNPALKGYAYDLDKARALLQDAGVAGGFSMNLRSQGIPLYANAAVFIKDNLAKIKVDVNVEELERQTFVSTAQREGVTGVAGQMGAAGTSPAFNFDRFMTTGAQPPKGVNYGFYSNAEVDQLVEEAARTSDSADRARTYHQAEEIMTDDSPWLFLHHGPFDPMVGVKNLHYVAANTFNYTLRNAYFEEE